MSVVLSSITGQTAESSVDIAGITVNFVWKPYVVTVEMSMKLADGGVEMISVLADTLESWDLVLNEGESFPPTEENILQLPIELATMIARKVTSGTDQDGKDEVGEADSSFAAG